MGQVHSTVSPGRLYNVNPRRFSVREFQCYLNEGDRTFAGPMAEPLSSSPIVSAQIQEDPYGGGAHITATKQDRRPLTFVLDPESDAMLLQLPYHAALTFRFVLSVSVTPGEGHTKLLFAHAASNAELQQIITQRQTGNWVDVAEWADPAHPKVEHVELVFGWDNLEEKVGGQPVHFAFFFEDKGSSAALDAPPAIHLNSGGAVWVDDRINEELSMLFEPTLESASSPTETAAYTPFVSHTPAMAIASPNPKQQPQSAVSQPQSLTSQTQISAPKSAGPLTASTSGDVKMPYGVPLGPMRDPTHLQAPRPSIDQQFQTEDGPQFRSAIASMERRVPQLKARTKQLLKRGLISRERLQALVEADTWLASGIQEAARVDFCSLKPVADWFSRHSEGGLSAIQRQRKAALNELTTRIVEPLQQFYEYDIKIFEQKKREFEEESSQFYSWTSRYLSARKEARRGKTPEVADSKFAVKKRAFDAARFDYFSYLSDLTMGLKQQVLLQLLALAAQSITDSHIALGNELATRTQPHLDDIVEDIKLAARDWEKYRLDNLSYRKALKENTEIPAGGPLSTVSSNPHSSNERQISPEPSAVPVPATPGPPIQNYKEGLLWASNRPAGVQDTQGTNKQSLQNLKWHKFWVVLDGSSLREYTNWKQSVDLHNEPINLLIAGVREARNSERRFCFEVVTPQYKRVYQAMSEEDMRSWITTIHNSISTLLEGTDDQQKQSSQPTGHHQNPVYYPGAPATSPSSPGRDSDLDVAKRGNLLGSTMESGQSIKHNGERIESLTRKLSFKSDKPRVPPIITNLGANSQQPIVGSPMMVSTTHPQTHHSLAKGEKKPSPTSSHLQHPHHFQQPHLFHGSDHGVHRSATPHSGSHQAPLTPSLSSPYDELLLQIQRIPSNRVCAECRNTKSVEWVSINLLMVLCIECSGAHRSLGSHISKVRSLTLDTGAFTPSLNAALLSVSNESMNQIWEAKMHRERKISADATGQARVKFVTEKYVEKLYINEVEKPNAALRRAIFERDIPKMCAALASRANPNGVSDDNEPMLIHALRSALPTDKTFPAAEVLIKNGAIVPGGTFEYLSLAAQTFLAQKQAQV